MLAVVVSVAVWVFRSDAPREVDAERALDQDADAAEDPPPDEPDDPPEPDDEDDEPEDDPPPDDAPYAGLTDLTGTWHVDTSRPFDRATGTGSFVGYRIEEELSGVGANTAVGRSPLVDGAVVIEDLTVVATRVDATLDGLESDDGRRDNRVRSMLGPDAMATFELDEPIELPEIPPVGEVVELETVGTLTILDTSHEVTVTLQAVVTAGGLLVAGSTEILLSDFGLEAPSAPIVLSVADEAVIEWQLFLTRAT